MAICQSCWDRYRYKEDSKEWIESLPIGSVFLHAPHGIDYEQIDPSGADLVMVTVITIEKEHIVIQFEDERTQKLLIEYAFTARPFIGKQPVPKRNRKRKHPEIDSSELKMEIDELYKKCGQYLKERDSAEKRLNKIRKDLETSKELNIKLFLKNETLAQENKKLQQMNEEHMKRNVLDDKYRKQIKMLNMEQLNHLEQTVKNAKQTLFDNKVICVICMDRCKNIVIEGCNHFVLCEQCEKEINPKQCPVCRNLYFNAIKIRD